MKNQRLVSYYSVVRFAPYPETDEFVNVGVVLACPSIGFLDFKRARRRLARVSDFFPELDPRIFSSALGSLGDALSRHRCDRVSVQMLTDVESRQRRDAFFTLVRPREAILYFSEPRAILSEAPDKTLAALYEAYVDRRFAQLVEYQEVQMGHRLEKLLRDHELLARFQQNKPVGDDHYRVNFPFVRFADDGVRAQRAIKALHLDKAEPTDIFRHADSWRDSVIRLQEFGTAPADLLFVMHPPSAEKSAAHLHAFDRVLSDYQGAQISVVLEGQADPVLKFAQQ
jgi:hypothetical protein